MPEDVLVVGGGPAGCAAARLLALWGHDVRLLTRETAPALLAESIPPSCGKLFDRLGVREAIEAAGFVPTTGNTVWWGRESPRVERFAGGERGWQVEASALEPILRHAARQAGARVEIARVSFEDLASSPALLLDCTGRAGLVARARGWRTYEPHARTVALVGLWHRGDAWPVPDPTHTLIESYADGWAWSVPKADGRRFVAVMVDPAASRLAKGAPPRDLYLGEIAKTRRFARLLEPASLDEGPAGWDASMYSSVRYADEGVLLAGDAASFVDPLSSIGIKKALASGWLAAIAAHTALVRPSMRQTAFDFFAAREDEIYRAFRTLTWSYLSEAAEAHAHPFWSDRADPAAGAHDEADEDVRAAFDRLKAADRLDVARTPDLRVESRPAVSGCEIVLEARIISPAAPAGIRYVSDVDVLALIDLAPSCRQVPDLFEKYNRGHAPVALPDFLKALATAIARNWLRER